MAKTTSCKEHLRYNPICTACKNIVGTDSKLSIIAAFLGAPILIFLMAFTVSWIFADAIPLWVTLSLVSSLIAYFIITFIDHKLLKKKQLEEEKRSIEMLSTSKESE